jgi:hypothetical protein
MINIIIKGGVLNRRPPSTQAGGSKRRTKRNKSKSRSQKNKSRIKNRSRIKK